MITHPRYSQPQNDAQSSYLYRHGNKTAIASAALEGMQEFQDPKERIEDFDLTDVVIQAKAHLKNGDAVFPDNQKKVIEDWISKAEKKLEEMTSRIDREMEQVLTKGGIPLTAQEGAQGSSQISGSNTRKSKKSSQIETKIDEHRSKVEAPGPATFKALIEKSKEASASRKPSKERLEKEDPELYHTLLALSQFVKMPNEIQKSTSKEVQNRIDLLPALGSRDFIKSLKSTAFAIAENAFKDTKAQNKKVLIAASGPGTGKTTGILTMIQWANVPVCMLSGEKFNALQIPSNKTAYDLLIEYIKDCVVKQFQLGNKRVTNGILFLDDWHYVLEGPNGLFYTDQQSRKKFISLLKNLGDGAQETPFEVELAPGRPFHINLSRVQTIMTLNKIPEDLSEKGDIPTASRFMHLDVTYPDDTDRTDIALLFLPLIKNAIQERYGAEALSTLDEKECRERLTEVAHEDIAMANKYNGRLGVRGLVELLDQYKQHVIGKFKQATFDSKICSFSGGSENNPPFIPKSVSSRIISYRKQLDENMVLAEFEKNLVQRIEELQAILAKTSALEKPEKTLTEELINTAQSDKNTNEKRQAALDEAFRKLKIALQRTPLPSRVEVGKGLLQKFGHLKASQNNDPDNNKGNDAEIIEERETSPFRAGWVPSGQRAGVQTPARHSVTPDFSPGLITQDGVDRFKELETIIENIHDRLVRAQKGIPFINQLIRVRYLDQDSHDPDFFKEIGKTLGNSPVCEISELRDFFHISNDIYGTRNINIKLKLSDVTGKIVKNQIINDAGEIISTNSIGSALVNGNFYFYISNPSNSQQNYYLIPLKIIENLCKTTNHPETFQIKESQLLKLSTGSFIDQVEREFKPKFKFFDHCMHQFNNNPATERGIVVIHNTDEIQNFFNTSGINPYPQTSPPQKAIGEISDRTNKSENYLFSRWRACH